MLDDGFLIVWNDISPEIEEEYQRWHRSEHMPERLAVPGFTLGRRYVDPAGDRYRYLTLYEVSSPAVFESDIYRERLASPTPWTRRMSAQMTNFVRRVCRTGASAGSAIGAAAATFWIELGDDGLPAPAARRLVDAAIDLDGVAAAHFGLVDQQITGVRRDEMQTRAAGMTEAFNAVFIVECDGRPALSAMMPKLGATIAEVAGVSAAAGQIYDLALIYRPSWQSPPGTNHGRA